MALPVLLSAVYYRYYRTAGPSTGYPIIFIRTAAGYIRSTAAVRSTTSLWWWIPRGFVDAGTGVSQRGRLQFLKMSFLRIIRLLMISASIQKI